jgi:hypothetical protein
MPFRTLDSRCGKTFLDSSVFDAHAKRRTGTVAIAQG